MKKNFFIYEELKNQETMESKIEYHLNKFN